MDIHFSENGTTTADKVEKPKTQTMYRAQVIKP
jgi:hypothetical protein